MDLGTIESPKGSTGLLTSTLECWLTYQHPPPKTPSWSCPISVRFQQLKVFHTISDNTFRSEFHNSSDLQQKRGPREEVLEKLEQINWNQFFHYCRASQFKPSRGGYLYAVFFQLLDETKISVFLPKEAVSPSAKFENDHPAIVPTKFLTILMKR